MITDTSLKNNKRILCLRISDTHHPNKAPKPGTDYMLHPLCYVANVKQGRAGLQSVWTPEYLILGMDGDCNEAVRDNCGLVVSTPSVTCSPRVYDSSSHYMAISSDRQAGKHLSHR